MAGRKLLDPVDQGPRAGHVIQRKIAIQARQTDSPLDFRMNKNGFELGTEEDVFTETAQVERLDA